MGSVRLSAMGKPFCSIIPPYVLERLAQSDDAELAAHARRALVVDEHLRQHRARADAAPTPRKPRVARGTLEGGPVRLISDAHGSEDLPGDKVRGEGDPATHDVAATEAYDGLGDTWHLYAEAFARNSLDDKGLPLRATVHYGDGYDNAFWDGTQMVFGDGDGRVFGRFTASLDVIGHELAHGVTEHTAGLLYQDQSGALNESLSDVFGSLVKQKSLGQSADQADWLIGAELLIGDFAGQALRSMKAPGTAYDNSELGKDPQPATMADYVETDQDHGGVHINSGIPNRAFYLVATAIGGNAWAAPGRIWYAALTGPDIAADCDFATFAGLTQAAATQLFGAESSQVQAVTAAWTEVGVLSATGSDGAIPPSESGSARRKAPKRGPSTDGPTKDSVVAVSRSGGLVGRTLSRRVALSQLPSKDESAWRDVLSDDRLAELFELATLEATHPDRFCYGVACDQPRVDVSIAEQHLPDRLRRLFDRTLRDG